MSVIMAFLIPATPLFALTMGASQFEIGLIGSVGVIVYVILAFTLSGLWDRTGGKTPILLSGAIYSLVCLLTSFIGTTISLIALKVVEGLALSMLWPPIESYVAVENKRKRDVISNFCIAWSSGNVLGALLSGFALEWFTLPSIFQLASFGAGVITLISFFKLKETERKKETYENSTFLDLEGKKEILTNFKISWLSMIIYAMGQSMLIALFPAYAEIMGVPYLIIGFSTFLLMGGRTFGFWAFRKIHMKQSILLKLGAALISAGSIVFALTLDFHLIFISSFVIGFGASLLYTITFDRIMTTSEGKHHLYAGIFEGSIGVGYLTPIIGGALAESYLTAPYILSSSGALLFLLLLVLNREKPIEKKTST
ncbi:MFS transporter [Candidatus Bathyarchaeota archaeon]|nr:MFS transporter [Candidatus Bathyarchaeota archaeon]